MSKQRSFEASGIVGETSSRVAKSGSHAHSFRIRGKKYSFFIEDPQHPLIDGDIVRFSFQTRTLRGRHKTKYHVAALETLSIDAPSGGGTTSEDDQPAIGSGTLYIASNGDMSGLLKIGYTMRDPSIRVAELGAVTGVPTPFKLEWTMPVERSAKQIESMTHSKLRTKRAGKEFFRVSLQEAQNACKAAYLAVHPDGAQRLDEGLADRAEEMARARETRDARLLAWNSEQGEKRRQKAWKQSNDGRWRLQESTRWLIEDFDNSLDRGQAPFHLRLFGRRNPDFLDMQISFGTRTAPHSNHQVEQPSEWHISAFGWRNGEPCTEEAKRAFTWQDAVKMAMQLVADHPATNRRITVSVPNANLRSPERSAGSAAAVATDFIAEQLRRMELVPESKNGARAPDDWQPSSGR